MSLDDRVPTRRRVRCAIYTRKSSEEGLEQDFNSLDAQREACAAYVASQASEGWSSLPELYDDGGISGGTLVRPALQRLLSDVKNGQIDIIVVYKVDRLTRSLLDFAKLVEAFDEAEVSFVSVTQSFNTTTSMGRLTLNMLLSFAQFEREVTAERIRDKIAQSKAKGMWMGGTPPLGYKPDGNNGLTIIEDHAAIVRDIFKRYSDAGNVRHVTEALEAESIKSPLRTTRKGKTYGGFTFTRGQIYHMLKNPIYAGDIGHKGKVYPGNHQAIVDPEEWDAVQAQLAEHVRGTRQKRQETSALLAGLLFDDKEEPLIPVHTSKPIATSSARRRYSYYVSKAAHHGAASCDQALRIPAQEIEEAVRSELAAFLLDPLALLDLLKLSISASQFEETSRKTAELRHTILSGAKQPAQALLGKVIVHHDALDLVIDGPVLIDLIKLPSKQSTPDTLTHRAHIRLTRTGHTLKLIDLDGKTALPKPDPALIRLLLQARKWWNELAKGEIRIAALARREEVSPSYVSRVIRLNFLAPKVVEAILAGTQQAAIDTMAILKPETINPDWQEQERNLLRSSG